jgi:hypothetical protein
MNVAISAIRGFEIPLQQSFSKKYNSLKLGRT